MAGYETHHVLIFDNQDDLILAGAGLKLARHPNAGLYFSDLQTSDPFLAGKAFVAGTHTPPWKLHVIEHGSHESMDILEDLKDQAGKKIIRKKVPVSVIAKWIVDSGIAEQPKSGQLPKVRLDVCESGHDLSLKKTNSLVMQLVNALKGKLPKNSKVWVEGCPGTCVGPWTAEQSPSPSSSGGPVFKSGKRQVISPDNLWINGTSTKVSDADTWTVSKTSSSPKSGFSLENSKSDYAKYLWRCFAGKTKHTFSPGTTLEETAKNAYVAYKKTVQDWYAHLEKTHNTKLKIFLPKDKKTSYLLREVASN